MIFCMTVAEPDPDADAALEDCIARIAGGDKDALADLYNRTRPAVYGFALSIVKNAHDAEDILHDACLQVWNAAGGYRRQGKPMAWVLTITRNLAINRLRDGNAQRRGGGQVPLALEELGECVSPEGSPEGELDRQAAEEALNRFLDGLPPLQREVFLRRYWYLDSIEDIARRAGWSKSRVTTTLHRLRVRLRAHLIQEGIDV